MPSSTLTSTCSRRQKKAGTSRPRDAGLRSCRRLLEGAGEREDLDLVGAELLGDLILHGGGDTDEARLVDVLDELDAHALELLLRLMIECDGLRGLRLADFVGGRLDPLLLLFREAVPCLVADPDDRVVGFMLGERHDRRDFV